MNCFDSMNLLDFKEEPCGLTGNELSGKADRADLDKTADRLAITQDEKLEEILNRPEGLLIQLLDLLNCENSQDRDNVLKVINLVSKRIKGAPCVKMLPWEEILLRANNSTSSPFLRNFSLVFLDTAFRRCVDRKARQRIIAELENLSETEQQLCPSVERARKVQLANKGASTSTQATVVVTKSEGKSSVNNNAQWSAYSKEAGDRYKADVVCCPQPKRLSADELAALSAQTETSDDLASKSALHNNISSKGKNSYYHAHQRKGPAAPSLGPTLVSGIGSSTGENLNIAIAAATGIGTEGSTPAAAAASAVPKQRVVGISKYGFLDDTGKVRVYIDFKGASDIPKEQVVVETELKSFVLTVTVAKEGAAEAKFGKADSVRHVLKIDELYGEITKGVVKQKKDKLVLTLTKKVTHSTWYALKG
jgi:hypothetical protein